MARSMTKQMEALRLIHTTTLSDRQIASALSLSKTTVSRYRKIAAHKGLTWEQMREWSPAKVDASFNKKHNGNKIKPRVSHAEIHDYLIAHRMTLQVWYEDYSREHYPNHRSYSNISAGLRAYRTTLPSFMHKVHVPGQTVEVDFTGATIDYHDRSSKQRRKAVIFVGALPASSYTFAVAIESQSGPDFFRAHAAMFDFFGGVPDVVVPDNAKCAMITSGPDGEVQRGYADLTRHYGIVPIAARAYRPKDKAKVEAAVKFVDTHVLARLRTFTFYSLDEINERLTVLLAEANDRPMSNGLPSRRQRFDAFERTKLKPLPEHRYDYAEIKPNIKVDGGYHIVVQLHRYSVPHALVGQRVDARVTTGHVEVFHENRCVAKHARSCEAGGITTDPRHQPDAHRAQADRTPEALRTWAKSAGPVIARFVEHQFKQDRPYLGLRPADTLKTLAGKYGNAVVDKALASYPDLSFVTVTDLRRKLSIQAKDGASVATKRSSNAGGSNSYA